MPSLIGKGAVPAWNLSIHPGCQKPDRDDFPIVFSVSGHPFEAGIVHQRPVVVLLFEVIDPSPGSGFPGLRWITREGRYLNGVGQAGDLLYWVHISGPCRAGPRAAIFE